MIIFHKVIYLIRGTTYYQAFPLSSFEFWLGRGRKSCTRTSTTKMVILFRFFTTLGGLQLRDTFAATFALRSDVSLLRDFFGFTSLLFLFQKWLPPGRTHFVEVKFHVAKGRRPSLVYRHFCIRIMRRVSIIAFEKSSVAIKRFNMTSFLYLVKFNLWAQ